MYFIFNIKNAAVVYTLLFYCLAQGDIINVDTIISQQFTAVWLNMNGCPPETLNSLRLYKLTFSFQKVNDHEKCLNTKDTDTDTMCMVTSEIFTLVSLVIQAQLYYDISMPFASRLVVLCLFIETKGGHH